MATMFVPLWGSGGEDTGRHREAPGAPLRGDTQSQYVNMCFVKKNEETDLDQRDTLGLTVPTQGRNEPASKKKTWKMDDVVAGQRGSCFDKTRHPSHVNEKYCMDRLFKKMSFQLVKKKTFFASSHIKTGKKPS